jgi:hypothetical protein
MPETRIRNQPNGETTGTGWTRAGRTPTGAGVRVALAPRVATGAPPEVVADEAGVVAELSAGVLVVRSSGVAMGRMVLGSALCPTLDPIVI